MSIVIKSPRDIDLMRQAGRIAAGARSVARQMIAPGEKKEYDLIHGAGLDVWVHSCGDIRKILPDLIEMGADVLNPVQPECMDIYDLKRQFGRDLTFWGGISTQKTLPYGTPDEVREETRRVTAALGENGGYLIAAAQGIQADLCHQQIFSHIFTSKR